MTMLRPGYSGLVSRTLDSVGAKAVLAAVLSATAWHYTDAGEIKGVKDKSRDNQNRLDVQDQELRRKVDREDYQADRKELHDDLREIRLSQDQIKQLLMERSMREGSK